MPRPVPKAHHTLSSVFLTRAREVTVIISILQKKKLRLNNNKQLKMTRVVRRRARLPTLSPWTQKSLLSKPHQPLGTTPSTPTCYPAQLGMWLDRDTPWKGGWEEDTPCSALVVKRE